MGIQIKRGTGMKVKILIPIILIVLAGLFYTGYKIGGRRAESVLKPTIDAQNGEIQRYVTRIGDDSVYIAQKETEILTQKEAIRRGEIERKELRALNLKQVSEINRLNLRVDTLLEDVNNSGGVITIHDTITLKPTNYIKLPFVVTKNDQWLSLKDSTDIKGKSFVNLKMNLALDVWTGRLKGTKELTTLVTTDSPYIGIIGIKSQKYDLPKPKKYGVGVFLGYGINLSGTVKASPMLGLGVNYNFIQF